ncbi:MAG: FAD-dependent oxidoreductase, partial [Clostridia bacterium]|nr:FAD-dependent oxidoreductase [Clostridia bacterium]
MSIFIVDEANRCLNCKKPLCQQGCPIHTPIPKVIRTFLDEGLDAAGEMLFNNNPLSVICSLVCDHEKQCEGHCVLGRKGSPIHFSQIENYISDTYLDRLHIECAPKNGHMIAMIGSGPASLSAAILLTKMGYEVTVFEAKERMGGVLRYGIPNFRLPKEILNRYKRPMLEIGIKFRPNTTIGGALQIEDLLRDGYESIFIGTGVWRPRKLGVKGESLGNVHFAIDYLTNPDVYNLGSDVVVIGAGNAAMDVARTARRTGAKHVTVYERAQKPNASPKEITYAQIDGVEIV